jgi:tetratricopeptide (TPR) repeat protein
MRGLLLTLAVSLATSTSANAACEVGKMLELKVTMQGEQPLSEVTVNGHPLEFIVDSGAFYSSISPGTAGELGLPLDSSPIQVRGIGGDAGATHIARVKAMDLAGLPLHNMEFIVAGSETKAGLLGQNVLGIGDVEYDLGHGAVRLMRAVGCSNKNNLAYWSGDAPVSDLPIDDRDPRHPYTIGTVLVDGVKLRAIFDTGAGTTLLTREGARRAGLTPSTPGVIPFGVGRGVGRSVIANWLAPVSSVKIGTEEVKNIKLRFGDFDLPDADMLIGADFFMSHHVYVANSVRRMYFTYDGGPIFNSKPSKVVDDEGKPQTIAANNSPEPTDAAGFSRRGAAETSLRDYKAALADLDRAVSMDPTNGRYLLQRARAETLTGNRAAAFADLDQAVKVAGSDPEIRLARAESLLARTRKADALDDLAALDGSMARQADERLTIAAIYERLDQFERAIADYDQWIAAHPDDSRQASALNGRCWARALADRDLPLALKDCDAALRRAKSGAYFDSRGLVELRLGQYDKAIADYSAALQLSPKSAWSLYGRGLARRHLNDAASKSDLDAAVAIDPTLPSRAQKLGIS